MGQIIHKQSFFHEIKQQRNMTKKEQTKQILEDERELYNALKQLLIVTFHDNQNTIDMLYKSLTNVIKENTETKLNKIGWSGLV